MDSLNIAGKAVRLCIDNDERRVIEFYPTDVSFAENFYALAAEFEERQNDIKARSAAIAEGDGSKLEKSRAELALTREAVAFLREGIDRPFGPGTASGHRSWTPGYIRPGRNSGRSLWDQRRARSPGRGYGR